jgi:hypothetical protein
MAMVRILSEKISRGQEEADERTYVIDDISVTASSGQRSPTPIRHSGPRNGFGHGGDKADAGFRKVSSMQAPSF